MCKIYLLLLALKGKIKLLTQANSIVDNQPCIFSGFYSIFEPLFELVWTQTYSGNINKANISLKKITRVFVHVCEFHLWLLHNINLLSNSTMSAQAPIPSQIHGFFFISY